MPKSKPVVNATSPECQVCEGSGKQLSTENGLCYDCGGKGLKGCVLMLSEPKFNRGSVFKFYHNDQAWSAKAETITKKNGGKGFNPQWIIGLSNEEKK